MSGFLLDTVVISELRKAHRADHNVLSWHQDISAQSCFISVITLTEIRSGILKVETTDPPFASRLENWYQKQVTVHFRERFLPVDRPVSETAAALIAQERLTPFDALIGATALVHSLTLVTRNTAHFETTKIDLINPWQAP
jgi:toxin FitB